MYLPYIAPVLLSFLLCVLVSINILRRPLSPYLQDTSALCDSPPCRRSSGSVVDVLVSHPRAPAWVLYLPQPYKAEEDDNRAGKSRLSNGRLEGEWRRTSS